MGEIAPILKPLSACLLVKGTEISRLSQSNDILPNCLSVINVT